MELWKELFSSEFGIMSAIVIAVVIGMGGYIGWFVRKHVKEEEAAVRR
ncbi:hypothetical protein HNQ59_003070 [Chitinivorax tropicus]|uniref:DUF3149 domain-containing protein n=1 Tax=Chitinivorax tropicus TaxID=714531 RepID=A0A840MSM1_9PROT|nr:DUF3149 domain-containing protein [Chitinivorax tropicus]MBB5019762.1 hypothetical protein [Chitinivorax tropicus]